MTLRHPSVYFPLLALTAACALVGWVWPTALVAGQYWLMAVLVLTVGLPHGATDYLLYQHLAKDAPAEATDQRAAKPLPVMFFLSYLGLVAGYLLGWRLWPTGALGLFLAISAYHFGQSNWQYLPGKPGWGRAGLYALWGSYAVAAPVLWHWPESQLILRQLGIAAPTLSSAVINGTVGGLAGANALAVGVLAGLGYLSGRAAGRELLNLLVLSALFYAAPVLVGFSVYFVGWHSLGSLLDQLAFFRRRSPDFSLADYYRQAAPYTLLAVAGLGLLVVAQPWLWPDGSVVSLFFTLISCVTLPHVLLIEATYETPAQSA